MGMNGEVLPIGASISPCDLLPIRRLAVFTEANEEMSVWIDVDGRSLGEVVTLHQANRQASAFDA